MRYFVALAEDLHFGRAAERLGVAQPSLSQQVRRLEEELGVELVLRTPRQIELTDAGREFVARAREVLARAELAADEARQAARGEVGRLAVGFTPFVASFVWPVLLERFRAAFPSVEIVGRERWSSELLDDLARGGADVGLATWPARPPNLAFEALCREANVVVVGASHPLARRRHVALGDLAGETLELWPRDLAPAYYDAVLADCHAAGFEPAVREAPTLGSVWMTTRNPGMSRVPDGLAVGLVPGSAAAMLDASMVALPLRPASSHVEYVLCTDPARATPAVRAFVGLARAVAREEGWLAEEPLLAAAG
jgi:DNA-binding transcriptional LysR family regulator